MGHRFSKSSISSHGTSAAQRGGINPIATNNSGPLTAPNSIAIPFADSQEINFEIEECPRPTNSTAGIVNQHNQPDNNSLSSVTSTGSSCPRIIIKIQLTKMENNGNESTNVSTSGPLQAVAETRHDPGTNANRVMNVECSDGQVVSKTAGSFSTNSSSGGISRHSAEQCSSHISTGSAQYRLVGPGPSEMGTTSEETCEIAKATGSSSSSSGSKYCYRFSSKANPTFALKHHCGKFTSAEALKQYMESTASGDKETREATPIAVASSLGVGASVNEQSAISLDAATSDQLSIWTPNSNDVIIQSPQIVVLCPSSSLVTLSDGFVRSMVSADVVNGTGAVEQALSSSLGKVSAASGVVGVAPAGMGGVIVHSQVDFVHHLVPDLDKITNSSFYWGKMDRYEAERLLEGKAEGTFLLRDSAQEEFLFSVTFRKYGRSLHARIEQSGHKFSFDCHDPGVFEAPTVTGLLEHYKDPACVMFFEPMLTVPLHRTQPFSLQQLSRATIVSNITYDGISKLELPMRLKAYLKEYHYKQKLRTKPCDEFS